MSSDREDHRVRWDDELAAYVLDALDEREAVAVATHLDECATCSERVDWLAPALDVLPAAVPQEPPPPALRARLLEIVEREAALEAAAKQPASADGGRRRISLPIFGSFAMRPALAGFGVALLLIAGVVGYALRDGASSETRTYAAVASAEDSLASGTLAVDGDGGTLHVADLPAAGRDEVYQAWVQHTGPGGHIVPSSVFVVDDEGVGEVAIPEGLEGADKIMVTQEPAGGSDKPTSDVLLTAAID